MSSTFFERIDSLAEQVGDGHLKAKLTVDQVYAHYQHEGTEFAHPRGGQAHYLRDPLFTGVDEKMQRLADRLLTPDGSEIREAMIDLAEGLAEDVYERAPREHGNLRQSGHPQVFDDGVEVYDRPPHVERLTEGELRAEHLRAKRSAEGAERRTAHLEGRARP